MIGKRGCVSLAAIHRNYWTHAKYETCLARIDQLVRGGYLKRETTDVRGNHETIYSLDKKALPEFSDAERKTFYKKAPSSTEVKHVLLMGDVLDAFRSKIVAFTNEHELKSLKSSNIEMRDGEVPDGQVTIGASTGQQLSFYIEIDGAYHGSRLKQKIAELGKINAPVLWVTFSAGRLHTLIHATEGHATIKPILYDELRHI